MILLDAVRAITSDPPAPTSFGLKLLSNACEGVLPTLSPDLGSAFSWTRIIPRFNFIDFLTFSLRSVLVLHGPSTCDSLYQEVHDQLQQKAIRLRNELTRGPPFDRILSPSLINQDSRQPVDIRQTVALLDNDLSVDWLKRLHKAWQAWLDQLLMIRGILIYLDRSVLIQSKHMMPIW